MTKAKKPGPEPQLNEKLTLEIRKRVLKGMHYYEIQEELDITSSSWDAWVHKDYKDFRQLLLKWKKERFLKGAERLSAEIMELPHEHKLGGKKFVNDKVLRIKQKESEFLRSTLGKDEGYTIRKEVTGADGEPLFDPDAKEKANKAISDFLPEK